MSGPENSTGAIVGTVILYIWGGGMTLWVIILTGYCESKLKRLEERLHE
jgi:hypothetical protein